MEKVWSDCNDESYASLPLSYLADWQVFFFFFPFPFLSGTLQAIILKRCLVVHYLHTGTLPSWRYIAYSDSFPDVMVSDICAIS